MAERPPGLTREELRDSLQRFKKPIVLKPVIKVVTHWQIVVVGTIDSRQHNPLWYKLIGAISDAEHKTAQRDFKVGPGPTFAFDVGHFNVVCQPDKWEIRTTHKEHQKRIIDVSELVFRKLWEISILAFGINAQIVLPTKAPDTKRVLAEQAMNGGFGLPKFSGEVEAQVLLVNKIGEHETATVSLMGSPAKKSDVMLMTNRERRISKKSGYYDVGEMIRAAAGPAWNEAETFGQNVVNQINRIAEVPNAND